MEKHNISLDIFVSSSDTSTSVVLASEKPSSTWANNNLAT